jgi:integrase
MSGHVRRRGAKSWELKFDLGRDPLTGKRQVRYHSFKGTKRQAEVELANLIAAHSKGEYVDPSRTTVAEFLDRWERDWASLNVSPKTLERYSELLRNHVRPHVGGTAIQKLAPVHLSELYGKLLREGGAKGRPLAARTVGHVHRVLHRALGHAVKWGVVQKSAADHVEPPRVPHSEIEILRADDVRAVLQGLRGKSLYTIAAAALGTGMRRGELLALRWRDVDLDRGLVRVEQALEYTKAGGCRFKAPKTKHGRRTITIPPALISELRAHRRAHQERSLALGVGKLGDEALVFPAAEGGPRNPTTLTKRWSAAMAAIERAGITFHSLRHTHASNLIAAGLDVLTISRRLGHGSPAITLGVYGHLFADTDDRAAAVMEAALRAPGTD